MDPASLQPLHLPPGGRYRIRHPASGEEAEYRVSRAIGCGANSQTYLARGEDGSQVVLKCSRWDRHSREPTDLVIEERIIAQLGQRNLVRFLGRGKDASGNLILGYERVYPNPLVLLQDPALRRCLPNDPGTRYYPLPPPLALALCRDLLHAIEHMHARGFVHHDVKLTNLMVRVAGRRGEDTPDADLLGAAVSGQAAGVLIDMGGSRSQTYLHDLNRGKVDDAIVPPQLTPLYAPPEALVARTTADGPRRHWHPSIDVYAAGIVLYICLSGRAPYDHLGVATDDASRLLAVKTEERHGELRPHSQEALAAAPGVRELALELDGLLSLCLHPKPEKRPSAREAREYLQELSEWVAKGAEGARRRTRRPPLPRTKDGKLRVERTFYGTSSLEQRIARDRAEAREPDAEREPG